MHAAGELGQGAIRRDWGKTGLSVRNTQVYESGADDRIPNKTDVRNMNEAELQTCAGRTEVYLAEDMPGTTAAGVALGREEATKMLNEETRFPEKLDLRVGAQIMLIMVCRSILLCQLRILIM